MLSLAWGSILSPRLYKSPVLLVVFGGVIARSRTI
jgi:hypothetical protein